MNRKSGSSSSRPERSNKPGYNKDKGATRGGKPFGKRDDDRKPYRSEEGDRKPFNKAGGDRSYGDGEKRSFRKNDDKPSFRKNDGERKPFKKFDDDRSFGDGEKRPFRKNDDKPSFRKNDGERKPFKKFDGDRSFGDGEKRPFRKNDGERKPFKKFDEDRSFGDGEKRPFRKNDDKPSFRKNDGERKPYRDSGDGERKSYKKFDGERTGSGDRKRSFDKNEDSRPFRKREEGDRKPYKKFDGEGAGEERKPRKKQDDEKKYASPGRMRSFEQEDLSFGKKARAEARRAAAALEKAAAGETESTENETPQTEANGTPVRDIYEPLAISEEKKNNKKAPVIRKDPSRAVRKEDNRPIASDRDNKPYYKKDEEGKPIRKRMYKQTEEPTDEQREAAKREQRAASRQKSAEKKRVRFDEDEDEVDEDEDKEEAMPLNKYLAHCGVCSRRDAVNHIKEGKVRVNDKIETTPGYKIVQGDVVYYNDKKLTPQKGLVYILLNKPKDYITTNDDPQGRKTVMDLVANAGVDRLFPVGRLDRNTTGLLLITNDGDLTQKLAHPSFKVKKIYQVTTDKPVTKADFEKILNGVELEDGKAPVDALAYLETKSELGIEIHVGRNRIVRRIFESLGYEVVKLDRVMYGALTKKNLPRGKWRFLSDREIVLLKHFKS